jgi:hypothetical protein
MTVNLAVSQLRRDQMIRRFKECGIPIDVVGIEDISKVAGLLPKCSEAYF